jgi:membrane AbrB-like protein
MAARFVQACIALLIGAAGGLLFWYLRLPLPFMLGAMIGSAIFSIAGVKVSDLERLREPMLAVIGTMLGASFSSTFFTHLLGFAVPLAGLVCSAVLGAFLSYHLLRRTTTMAPETAYFAAMPGGVVEMVLLSQERGGDDRIVAVVHALRIFLVVATLPFLFELLTGFAAPRGAATTVTMADVTVKDAIWFAVVVIVGYGLSRLVNLPARVMLAPMIVSLAVHAFGWTDFKLPFELIAFAQVVIGVSIGARFGGIDHRLLLRGLGLSAIVTAVLISVAIAVSYTVHRLTGLSFGSLFLAYAPGGFTEMSLMALAMNFDVAFVVANHLFRVLLIIVSGGLVFDALRSRGWI